ncbi:MAG: tetratricopeptide repeat protein, partial [Proteobacteria bacterium]|nr:tetratricopeptide repeat protein [Pseudomonadota bacterium]
PPAPFAPAQPADPQFTLQQPQPVQPIAPEPQPAAAPEQQLAAAPAPAPAAPQVPAQPLPAADVTEPPRQISEESRHIVENLPPIGEKPQPSHAATEQLAILRGKSALDDRQPEPTTVNHESMGVKMQVTTPRFNMDYELEKAYNALIAGNSDAAAQVYRNVLENDPTNKNALFGLATIYHRAGQIESARPLYAKLLTIDPDNRDGLNNFLVLLADEAPEDALQHLERLKTLNPDFSPIPAQMAVIYQKLGQYDKATENMTRAIELAPENLAYRYNFAIMLDKQHKYEEAAQLYRQIMQAYQRGEKVPGNIQQIQQRLTFISSNRN